MYIHVYACIYMSYMYIHVIIFVYIHVVSYMYALSVKILETKNKSIICNSLKLHNSI